MAGTGESGSTGRVAVTATSTHLYRGARLVAGLGLPDGPAAVSLTFRDGVRVEAELLQGTGGQLALEVPAYRTAAGADIAAKAWRIARIEPGPDGGAIAVVGDRLGEAP